MAWGIIAQCLKAERTVAPEPAVVPAASRAVAMETAANAPWDLTTAVSQDAQVKSPTVNSAAPSPPAGEAKIVASIGGATVRTVDAAFRIGSSDGATATQAPIAKAPAEKPAHVLVAHEAAAGMPYGPQQPALPSSDNAPATAANPPAQDEDLRAPARPAVKEEDGYKPWFAPADGQANMPRNLAPRAPAAPSARTPQAPYVGGPGQVAVTADFPPPARQAPPGPQTRPTLGTQTGMRQGPQPRIQPGMQPRLETTQQPGPYAPSQSGPYTAQQPGPYGAQQTVVQPGPVASGIDNNRREFSNPPAVASRGAVAGVAERRMPAPGFAERQGGAGQRPFGPNPPSYGPPRAGVADEARSPWPVDPRVPAPEVPRPSVAAAETPANAPGSPPAPRFDEMFRDSVPAAPSYRETPYPATPPAEYAAAPPRSAGPTAIPRQGENAAVAQAVSMFKRPGVRRDVAAHERPPAGEPSDAAMQPGPEAEPGVPATALAHDRPLFAAATSVEMRMGAAESFSPPARAAVWTPQSEPPIASIVARSPQENGADATSVVPGPVADRPPQFRVAIDDGRMEAVTPGPGPQIDFVERGSRGDANEVGPAAPDMAARLAAAASPRTAAPADDSDPPEPEGEAVIASDDPGPIAERTPPRETAQLRGPALGPAVNMPAPRNYAAPTENQAAPQAYAPAVSMRRDSRATQTPLGYPITPPPGYGQPVPGYAPQSPATARGPAGVDPSWRR